MITIVNFGLGNIASISNMLNRIGIPSTLATEVGHIKQANKIILPGVGSFDSAVRNLKSNHLIPILKRKVLQDKIPALGICLGMQLLCKSSEEGHQKGLGWIEAECRRFKFAPPSKLKIPCMGWNHIQFNHDNPLFKGLQNPKFYFVHAYHAVCQHPANSIASAEYGYEYTVAIQKDNIYGVQFHPEKSHKYGMQLLKNFSEIGT